MTPHCGISNCGVFMEFLYSITLYKSGVYNILVKLQMITTFSTYHGISFPVACEIHHCYCYVRKLSTRSEHRINSADFTWEKIGLSFISFV